MDSLRLLKVWWGLEIWTPQTDYYPNTERLNLEWFGFGMVGHSFGYGPDHFRTKPFKIHKPFEI